MKKILLIITMVLLIGLGACESPEPVEEIILPNYDAEVLDLQAQIDILENELFAIDFEEYDDTELQLYFTQLEEQVNILIERFNNLTSITGINGITDYYENETQLSLSTNLTLATLSTTIEYMKDTLDKNSAPDYILDINEEYISFEDLAYLLKAKYFGSAEVFVEEEFLVGAKLYMQYKLITDEDPNEIFAKMALLVEELRLYTFYYISCPQLELRMKLEYNGNPQQIVFTIPIVTATSGFITITPDGLFDEDYEMRLWLDNVELDLTAIETYHNDFILNEIYVGYVLNYK